MVSLTEDLGRLGLLLTIQAFFAIRKANLNRCRLAPLDPAQKGWVSC